MSHMNPRELKRINCNMKDIKIPKMERHQSLLRGLSHGERCYMFSIISVYDPAPARRRLYSKHKMLCQKALSVNTAEKHHFINI
ncbi:protein FAM216B-like [Eleutherodactylus coqui]|uniref:protein FAM216B-like n=1 Tax=Eleutherodactylus coqui TaxID=57060 RepID=UPI0034622D51